MVPPRRGGEIARPPGAGLGGGTPGVPGAGLGGGTPGAGVGAPETDVGGGSGEAVVAPGAANDAGGPRVVIPGLAGGAVVVGDGAVGAGSTARRCSLVRSATTAVPPAAKPKGITRAAASGTCPRKRARLGRRRVVASATITPLTASCTVTSSPPRGWWPDGGRNLAETVTGLLPAVSVSSGFSGEKSQPSRCRSRIDALTSSPPRRSSATFTVTEPSGLRVTSGIVQGVLGATTRSGPEGVCSVNDGRSGWKRQPPSRRNRISASTRLPRLSTETLTSSDPSARGASLGRIAKPRSSSRWGSSVVSLGTAMLGRALRCGRNTWRRANWGRRRAHASAHQPVR